MSELLREIEEDIRAERMHNLWNKFGKVMIRVSIAVILGTAIGVVWKNYRESQAMDHTSQLLASVDKMSTGDYKGAIAAFDAIDNNNSIYADMALLQKGQAQEAQGDHEGAAKTYQTLAARGSDNAFVAMGKLLAAKETDAPLSVNNDAPLASLQNEMRGWQLLKAGKKDEAVQVFTALRDNDLAPRTQRVRALMALSVLAPEKNTSQEIQ
jgi:hypothetical protein